MCIYLVVYVDDIVITGDHATRIQQLKEHLSQQFHTKDLGPLKYFLGIEVAQSSSGIIINPRKCAMNILIETSMPDCRPCNTFMHPNIKLFLGQGEPLKEQKDITAWSPSDRRSTSGYCVVIEGNMISWRSKKQNIVVRSSAEAEYHATAPATCELMWLRQLLL
ncbi:uncharacterized protein LOC113855633 [Abrus precatorius]|uniref:Uncharacterized protein LOC113855633 n=1 Tax=Abrus precatorius TaxID=3816 RepID=A0A8B8KGX3_ABRPR|nr:uncharacterized protein LOC113855633 [Abrus precatorius]